MAINRFWRKATAKASQRRAAPVLTETGLSGPARRVNRLVAVMAVAGACGTVALAVALTPGAQTSASSANADQRDLAISRIDAPQEAPAAAPGAPEAALVEPARAHTTVVAMRPEPAPKGDRLFIERQAPRPDRADRAGRPELRGAGREEAGEGDAAMPSDEPRAAREAADSAERKLDAPDLDADNGRNLEFGLSEPPPPGDTGEDARAEDAEEASADVADEASEDDIEAVVDDAVAQAVPEQAVPEQAEPEKAEPEKVAATRTAPVRTDVNMRARPSNGAAVIQVVPGNSNVEVIGCDYWCEVMYDGRRGFIYKGFVKGS